MNKKALLEMLGSSLGDLLQGHERGEGKEIGTISPEMLAGYKAIVREEDLLRDEMEIEKEKLAREMKRRMEDTFDDRIDALDNKKEVAWREIEAFLGVSKESDLRISTKTGIVTHFTTKPEESNTIDFRPKR